jgi:type VI secretion system protein VasG
MIRLELLNLISRLESEFRTVLEDAADSCTKRGHDVMEPEHWYYYLCQQSTPWINALSYAGASNQALQDLIEQEISKFKIDVIEDPAPIVSPQLMSLLQEIWLEASINMEHTQANEYHLLLVLKERYDQGVCSGALYDWLAFLSTEWLKEQAHEYAIKKGHASAHSSEVYTHSDSPALTKYTLNLTQKARDNELDPISGRGDEIRNVIDILCRRRQNNPILVGEPGVGKTAIVEGLAQQIVAQNVPPSLRDCELLSLDLTLIQAGANIKGEFENRLKDILNEIKQSPKPIIIFIDEAHSLVGAGGAAGKNDAANILKPALARGEFRSIAATTWSEYKQYFESDAALARRFQLVSINEPSEEDAINMLLNIKKSLESHHGVRILQEAIEAAVHLSVRYMPDRKLPDKAISLLDTACARICLTQTTTPTYIEQLKERLVHLDKETALLSNEAAVWSSDQSKLNALIEEQSAKKTELAQLEKRFDEEHKLADQVIELQHFLHQVHADGQDIENLLEKEVFNNALDELAQIQAGTPFVQIHVRKETVAEVIALWTGIPVGKMMKTEIEQLKSLETLLGQRVIGQTEPLSEIAKVIRMSRAGLTDPRKPIGVFFMCGPSGVGKTETALALADILYGGEKNLTLINMTEFKEAHKVSMLLGAPAGYIGYGKGGVLTEAVRKNPYTVLLLDEIDKAHESVQDLFYQLFDKGTISDSEGRSIDFRNTIIIMTSNVADKEVISASKRPKVTLNEVASIISPALKKAFKPAFLGRCTMIPYLPLSLTELESIAALSLNRVKKRIQAHYQASLTYQPEVLKWLVGMNNSQDTGARAIEQLINRKIMPELALECLERTGNDMPINHIELGMDEKEGFKISIR